MSDSDPLEGLTNDHCRYVIGDTHGEWCYCRAPRARHADGRYKPWKWCDAHRKIVVKKAEPYKPKPKNVTLADRLLDMEEAA